MGRDDDPGGPPVTPDAAFASLANETRLGILRVLGEADGPLRFSEVRERTGLPQGGSLHYHLDRLVGHFVLKTAEGYRLSHAGRRIVEAVRSGAVTETPERARTPIDWPCERCGATIEVTYREERVERYCPDCSGTYGHPTRPDQQVESGYLGALSLPPAGLRGRSALEMQAAAAVWGHLEVLTAVSGVCPSCSARVESTVTACESHGTADGRCDDCGNWYAARLSLRCSNCPYTLQSAVGGLLVVRPEVLGFLARHGITPFAPTTAYPRVVWGATEEIRSTDPFRARFTFAVDDDRLSVTVDETLTVVETAGGG